MSHWNHRVLATEHNGEIFFGVHEVYYDDEGKPNASTKEAVRIGSECIEGIQWQLTKIYECLQKPILWGDERFPQEFKMEENEKP